MSKEYIVVFDATPEKIDIDKPGGYPAVLGGRIVLSTGEELVVDEAIVENEEEYESFVEFLHRITGISEGNDRGELEQAEKSLGRVFDILSGEDELRKALEEYSTIVDDFDVDIVKAGWQLGVKRYAKQPRLAGVVGYETWGEYEGISRETSERINAYLWDMAFLKKRFDLGESVREIVKKFGLDEIQAERIVRTEFANMFNKMREWAYLERTDVKKFVWFAKTDACELCKAVQEKSSDGVTLDELKKLIKKVGGEYAREWTLHPQCRCTFIRKYGKKRGWEK